MKLSEMRKLIMLLLLASTNCFAGLHSITHHSRANCGNNESISWHAGHSYWFWIVSRHRGHNQDHQLVANWSVTWRSAAVHWGEGKGGWTVEGHHWMKENEWGMPYQVAEENVSNCSIYDGWWD